MVQSLKVECLNLYLLRQAFNYIMNHLVYRLNQATNLSAHEFCKQI